MSKVLVAKWQTSGKDYLELYRHDNHAYTYQGNGCSGCLGTFDNDGAAIYHMTRPWGSGGAGPVTVLKTDRPSLKRVK